MTDNTFSAVIIKDAIDESVKTSAEAFYSDLKTLIEKCGFSVTVHDCAVNTEFPVSDVWFADSCSEDTLEKLESAPVYIRVVNLTSDYEEDDFKLTAEKKDTVVNTLEHIVKLARFQERIIKLADKICMS